MAVAASLSLTYCAKNEIAPSEPVNKDGVPFEISASLSTKTVNDGLATKWAEGDKINLFHAVAGSTTYTSDNAFTLDANREGVFTGTLTGTLTSGTNYDWYAIYPYYSSTITPAATTKGWINLGQISNGNYLTQDGNDSKAHLCGTGLPLYGVVKNVASDQMPQMQMNNLTSVVAVRVKNATTEPLAVSSVKFTSKEDIVGTYYIDFTGDAVKYTMSGPSYVSSTASLTVKNSEIAAGAEATFYIPIKPHTVVAGSKLTLSVNGYEKESPALTKDVTFTAGKIKTLVFEYDKVIVDYVTIPWTEDFSGDLSLYTLTNGGTTTKTYNEKNAGGTAPELLISKSKGSFAAKVKADAGNYLLTFKSNNPSYLTVTASDENVVIKPESIDTNNMSAKYSITIPEGGSTFTLTFTNTTKNNARFDDVSLIKDERIVLSAPSNVMADLVANVPNSIGVVWDAVENAESYVVAATPTTGNAVTKEVSTNSCTLEGLAYNTEYTISIYAKSSDETKYINSSVVTLENKVTTGSEPAIITVDKANVTVAGDGDVITLKYSVKNPVEGESISAISSESWIKTFNFDTTGEVSFRVDANEGEERTATVTLSYKGAADVVVTIKQLVKGAVVKEPKSYEWDLTKVSNNWESSGCVTYFSQPYGIKKVGASITNKSINDFKDAVSLSISVKSLCNGETTSKLTIYLVDKDGKIIGDGKEITPVKASTASKTTYQSVLFDSVDSSVTGMMVKCTTFGKNVLINGVKYTATY